MFYVDVAIDSQNVYVFSTRRYQTSWMADQNGSLDQILFLYLFIYVLSVWGIWIEIYVKADVWQLAIVRRVSFQLHADCILSCDYILLLDKFCHLERKHL